MNALAYEDCTSDNGYIKFHGSTGKLQVGNLPSRKVIPGRFLCHQFTITIGPVSLVSSFSPFDYEEHSF